MVRGLLLIGLFFFFASAQMPSSVLAGDSTDRISAKEEYELSQECAKFAAEFIQENETYKDWIRTLAGSYTNHYNRKLNKCFVTVDAVVPETRRTAKTLWDINEHKRYGWFTSSLIDPGKAAACTMLGNPCESESEWDTFVKPYMEE